MRKGTRARALEFIACGFLLALCAACGGGGDGDAGGGNGTPPPVGNGIGSAGGTVTEPSGAKVVIPPGALTTNTAIAVAQSSSGAPPLPAGVTALGPMYAFTPHGTNFAAPVTITVPFTPSTVPAGVTPALYKTDGTLSTWHIVDGATVSGSTISGQVTGFSLAIAATPQPVTGSPEFTQKEWALLSFRLAKDIHSEDGLDLGEQVGGVVDRTVSFGTDLPFNVGPPRTDPRAQLSVFVNGSGHTYWTGAEAPANDLQDPDAADAGMSALHLAYTYKKTQANASLRILLTASQLEAIDDGGQEPGPEACQWLADDPSTADVDDDCTPFMSLAETSIDIGAHVLFQADDFFHTGGEAIMRGVVNRWQKDVSNGAGAVAFLLASDEIPPSSVDLWDDTKFEFDPAVGGSGTHATLRLREPLAIDIPLESVNVGETFNVDVYALSIALNGIQGESYISAFLRDPQQTQGLDATFTGLEQLPLQHDERLAPQPKPCTSDPSPDPAAGTLQFTRSAFRFPERLPGATVEVERVGGTKGDVQFLVESADGTAIADSDYKTVHTVVAFKDGAGGRRTLPVQLLLDQIAEPDESLTLKLTPFSGCASPGQRSTTALTILDDDRPRRAPDTHTVGGTVAGLAGSGLVIKNVNTGSSVTPGNGVFTLPDALPAGSSYNVRVDTQPSNPTQQCTVTNGTGTIAGADVTNVQVDCVSLTPSGSLDASFGTAGRVLTSIPFATSVFDPRMGMALQSDGRILLVGGLTLARFNSDGSPDTTFSGDGQVTVPFNGGAFDGALDVAVQADGKIVVVGVTDPGGQVGKDDFALARFNADGTLDTNFGTGGKTSTDIAGSTDIARRVRIQSDGKILVTGSATRTVSTVTVTDFALVRYNSDGTPDATFSLDGKVIDSPGRSFSIARGLAIQSDGKIVLTGHTADDGVADPDVGLVRYLGDGAVQLPGTRDETFGLVGNGTVDSDLHLATGFEEGRDVAVAADGTLMVAASVRVGAATGGSDFGFALAAFDSDGKQKGGALLTKFSDQSDIANSMTLQADGKIVVVGQSANLASNADMAVARYAANGLAADTSFDTDGKLTIDFFGRRDSAQAVVQQPDGKLVIGGFAQGANGIFFALARLTP